MKKSLPLLCGLVLSACALLPSGPGHYGEGEQLYSRLVTIPEQFSSAGERNVWTGMEIRLQDWKDRYKKHASHAQWQEYRATMLQKYGPLPQAAAWVLDDVKPGNQ